MKESQVLSGLETPLFIPKKGVVAEGREPLDLGPVDIIDVRAHEGAVVATLTQRDGESRRAVRIEILPYPADDFIGRARVFLRAMPESRKAPAPPPVDGPAAEMVAFGEVAGFQLANTKSGCEMIWSSVSQPRVVRSIVTSAQLETMRDEVSAVLSAMTKEERESRLVRVEGAGMARKIPLEK